MIASVKCLEYADVLLFIILSFNTRTPSQNVELGITFKIIEYIIYYVFILYI